ncbi:MAG: EAL domain-containing protein [Nitrospiraceae bacterium]|nr:EAL domain-containing protein [Nitrospiraceae bacterium]
MADRGFKKYLLMARRREAAFKAVIIIVVVLLMGNLSALIDRIFHPEIPYLDEEHLIMGGITAFVTFILLFALAMYTKRLRKDEERFHTLFGLSPDAMTLLDLYGNIIMANQQGANLYRGSADELIGKNVFELIVPEERTHAKEIMTERLFNNGHVRNIEHTAMRKDGSSFPAELSLALIFDTKGKAEAVIGTLRDITERKKTEKQIHMMAYYDPLTGLPNRIFFAELLKRKLEHAKRNNLILSIFFVDLDDFKRINDTLGHDVGDQLLQAVAKRLLKTMRGSDYVARSYAKETTEVVSRQGGDEFIILLHNLAQAQNAGNTAHRLLKELSEPYELSGREVFITASIGISLYPDDGDNAKNLLKNADTAMYQAKKEGKNNYRFYSRQMNMASLELLTLGNDLHRALERNEFVLYYQPKVVFLTRNITGVEALIRWRHADRGLISPAQFVPLAEANGLIIPIGEFVLRTACLQNRIWQEAGFTSIRVAVNLSGRQFDQKDLIKMIHKVLNDTRLSPELLELEITESIVMRNPEEAILTLQALKEMGIKIAIDDFGTGFSSLNYLKRLPLDFVKIDKSFVENVSASSSDAAIVKAIIAMAHSLNLEVIAEGVETEQQLAFLHEHGCDAMQGFLLCHPLPAEDFSKILDKKML